MLNILTDAWTFVGTMGLDDYVLAGALLVVVVAIFKRARK